MITLAALLLVLDPAANFDLLAAKTLIEKVKSQADGKLPIRDQNEANEVRDWKAFSQFRYILLTNIIPSAILDRKLDCEAMNRLINSAAYDLSGRNLSFCNLVSNSEVGKLIKNKKDERYSYMTGSVFGMLHDSDGVNKFMLQCDIKSTDGLIATSVAFQFNVLNGKVFEARQIAAVPMQGSLAKTNG
ncbi:MAG: hypothetical protein BVN32_05005 [Proteobacteria bacterium ST_bin14]|nr:MAG: hypothetical protein BVN32_05005 [Proteobacteria bacterium ST_bin14]